MSRHFELEADSLYDERINEILDTPSGVEYTVYITKPGLEIVPLNLDTDNNPNWSKNFAEYDQWIGQPRRSEIHVEEGGSRVAVNVVPTKHSTWRLSTFFMDSPGHDHRGVPWLFETYLVGILRDDDDADPTEYEEWLYSTVSGRTRSHQQYKEALGFHFYVLKALRSQTKFDWSA